MSIRHFIYRAGANPQKSWRLFLLGLIIFAPGVVLIFVGAQQYHMLQVPGLTLLIIGFIVAARGYAGLFANRFAQLLNRATPPSSEDN